MASALASSVSTGRRAANAILTQPTRGWAEGTGVPATLEPGVYGIDGRSANHDGWRLLLSGVWVYLDDVSTAAG